jgi:protein phosphatase 1 regulatory subunit 7
MASLDTVYFVQNKITTISNLQNLENLRSLELGGNRIRVCLLYWIEVHCSLLPQNIENLDALINLEELWLGKNKIIKLEVCYRCARRLISLGSLESPKSEEVEDIIYTVESHRQTGRIGSNTKSS